MEQAGVVLQHTLDQQVGLENHIQAEVDNQAEQGTAADQELHMAVGVGILVVVGDIQVEEGNPVALVVDSPAAEGDIQVGVGTQVVGVGSLAVGVDSQVVGVGSHLVEDNRVVEGNLVVVGSQLAGDSLAVEDNLVVEVDIPCWDHHSLPGVEAVPYL